ncbi:ABC transporter ATP-binding protein [Ligilactobacillus murinus]|uniref:ABC transporter ATP-binding protein n=1 Tax=Ligilactobacillus murinus TaxID=1622 RepID=UPI0011DDED2B|nr:ABC transporter ATP-binding protein [Ligilactobacillus murinus]
MIEFKGVTKKYDNVIALNNLNLVIPAGKIFGFLGHNGAGKSTTIKSLVSILKPEAGQIIVDGKDLAEQRFSVKKMIGYVPDSPDIFLQLTAAEYWDMLAAAYEIRASEKATRIKELAGSFGILEHQDEVMESYSHGMRQKAIIVGALLSEPDIWVLDEPLQGLDPQAAYDLKEMMKKHVAKGKTVIFSTHILDTAQQLCDELAILKKGSLLYNGTVAELLAKEPGKTLEQIYLELVGRKEGE